MPALSFERQVRHSASEMLDLIADVRSYPQFVPNCSAMQVSEIDGSPQSYLARMSLQFGPISQTYASRIDIDRAALTLSAHAVDGPFSHLESQWRFTPEGEGTRVNFKIDFSISNPLIAAIAEPAFANKQEEIMDAFLAEADRRYTPKMGPRE